MYKREREREREEKQRENKVFYYYFLKKIELPPKNKNKKINKMTCYQGTGLGCPVDLVEGFTFIDGGERAGGDDHEDES